MTDLSKLMTRFVDLYRADPDMAESSVSYGEDLASLEPTDSSLLQIGDNATHSKLRTLLLEDDQPILKKTSELRRKADSTPPLTSEGFRQKMVDALMEMQDPGSTKIQHDSGDNNFHVRGARTLGISVEEFIALLFEHFFLQLDGKWEQLQGEKFDALENFQRLESEREDHARFQRPDLEVALVRHFLATLDKRLDSLEKLEELNLTQIPQYLPRPFNEACHCYLNGQRFGCLALCAAIIESILKPITDGNTIYERVLSAKNKKHLNDDEGEKALSICNLRNDALHGLATFERALQKRKREMAKIGLTQVTDDAVWMQCLFDTRHLMKVLLGVKEPS